MSNPGDYRGGGQGPSSNLMLRVALVVASVAIIAAAGTGGVLAAKRANRADALRASASPSTSTSPQPSQTHSPAPAAPKCVAADAKGALGPVATDATHTTTTTVIVTNVSSHTCTIYGYGGMEMYAGGDGKPINIKLLRDPKQPPRNVTLKPGGMATKPVAWTSGSVPNDPACSASVGFVTVILPDDTKSFQIDGALGQVCLNGAVNGGAFR